MATTESKIIVELVHGGFILKAPANDGFGDFIKTEVFTSEGKLMKALRTAIDDFSLVVKKKPGEDKAE